MSDALALVPASVDPGAFFSKSQMELIRRQIAPKVTDDEFQVFLFQCARTQLDPMSRQIYPIVRLTWDPDQEKRVPKMAIQTGIDGFRLIAERTRRYAPGPEPVFEYDAAGRVRKATAFVKKQTADGTWHTVSASAYYDEYVQTYNGKPSGLWAKPHIMLGKCAESLALRKAFPAEMSGIYTAEEMSQAGEGVEYTPRAPAATPEPVDVPAPPVRQPPRQAPPPAAPPPGQPLGTDAPRSAAGGKDESWDASDTGEVPSEEDLDEFHDVVVKQLRWRQQHIRNWCSKYFGVRSPEAFTRAQLRDAFALVYAFAKSREAYAAKVHELAAAGRINADDPTPAPEARR
jgi:phage recombination protein Bet